MTNLWDIDRLAEYLGVPKKSIYNWRANNKGPKGIRVGRHIRFREEDVIAWLDAQVDA
ncbi:helix-turn-helix transcriptional regulator [Rhodococcus koreensis]